MCLAQEQGQKQSQGQSQPRTRRTQRVVPMKEVQVASPDGKVKFTLGSNPERLTWTVTLEDTTVIEPSPLDMRVDGYDLSSGVICNSLEPYSVDETYPWHGAHSMAVNRCNGAKVSLTHDLSQMPYILEIRVFNDGVAYRHVIAGAADAVRVPNEYSKFILPAGTTVWYHDLDGHYEAEYDQQDIAAGEGRTVGRSAGDLPIAGQRRLRLDHRGESGQLRRHGARKRRPPRLDRGPRSPTADQLSLRASLRPRGGQTSGHAGVGHRHHHHTLARGAGRPRPEHAGQQRHSAQSVSAGRPEVLSAGDEDALGPAEPVRLGLRGPQLRAAAAAPASSTA